MTDRFGYPPQHDDQWSARNYQSGQHSFAVLVSRAVLPASRRPSQTVQRKLFPHRTADRRSRRDWRPRRASSALWR